MASRTWIASAGARSSPDLFRSRQRLRGGEMRSDEASEIDDDRPNVGRVPVGHSRDVPVNLRLRQLVGQVGVLLWPLRKCLGRRGLEALPRENGQVGDADGMGQQRNCGRLKGPNPSQRRTGAESRIRLTAEAAYLRNSRRQTVAFIH